MSKKSKTKLEASPPPQSHPGEEQEPVRPNGTPAPQADVPPRDRVWGWLRPEEVEPADAARFDQATFDGARWAP